MWEGSGHAGDFLPRLKISFFPQQMRVAAGEGHREAGWVTREERWNKRGERWGKGRKWERNEKVWKHNRLSFTPSLPSSVCLCTLSLFHSLPSLPPSFGLSLNKPFKADRMIGLRCPPVWLWSLLMTKSKAVSPSHSHIHTSWCPLPGSCVRAEINEEQEKGHALQRLDGEFTPGETQQNSGFSFSFLSYIPTFIINMIMHRLEKTQTLYNFI